MAFPRVQRPLRVRHISLVLLALPLAALPFRPPAAAAQVNVEALRSEDPPEGRSGTFGGDLSVKTGNVDFVQLGLSTRLNHVSPRATQLLVADGGFGFLSRSRFASSGLLHYRVTYNAWHGIQPEWYGQLNYERPQLLDLRAVAGAGARTSFAGGAWGRFGAGSSLTLEHERLALPDTARHPRRTTTLRWSNFLTLRVVPSETMVITSTSYLQPEFRNPADVRVLENLRLRASVTETLALVVAFDLRYDSRPPDGIARLDTSLRTGLTYQY
jgi:hypothetical protein